jgi:hypothetical protein
VVWVLWRLPIPVAAMTPESPPAIGVSCKLYFAFQSRVLGESHPDTLRNCETLSRIIEEVGDMSQGELT